MPSLRRVLRPEMDFHPLRLSKDFNKTDQAPIALLVEGLSAFKRF